MRLTKHTDYAFRVLIYLAGMEEEKTTIQQITERFAISKPNLMKVVNELANMGWIHSTRGKNGGICLGIPANTINLRDVIVRMEKTLDPINCSSPMCLLKNVCSLKPILMTAQNEYLNHMSKYHLSDLIDSKTVNLMQVPAIEAAVIPTPPVETR